MHEPDLWTGDAELLELSIQGQRLIMLDIAEAIRGLWRRAVRPLDEALRELGRHRPLPPA
jgi:hypothetical protein